MDCPSCAKKIENAVTALPGVDSARVLFATEKLVVDAQSDISLRIRTRSPAGFTLLGTQTAKAAAPKTSRFGEFAPLLLLATLMVVSWVLDRLTRSWAASPLSPPRWSDWHRSPPRRCV